jgi:crotonobetainyl-CoA:carnitine CoA-transferase CaiB-like acyl-CoA transferase
MILCTFFFFLENDIVYLLCFNKNKTHIILNIKKKEKKKHFKFNA